MHNLFRDENGSAAVFILLFMSFLIGVMGLVIDYGQIASNRRVLQNAVDAAALAAVRDMQNLDEASLTILAKQYLDKNTDELLSYEVNPDENGSYTIEVIASKMVPTNFTYMLTGVKERKVSAAASAELSGIFGNYEYALFAGNIDDTNITITGNGSVVTGNVHSNSNVKMKHVDVVAGIVTTVDADNSVSSGVTVEYSDILPMPDYASLLIDGSVIDMNVGGSTYNIDEKNASSFEGETLYFDGDVVIDMTKSTTALQFNVIAEGEIHFTGSSQSVSTVCLISLSSSSNAIHFSGSKADIHAVIFAPNGSVDFSGTGSMVYGSIIADEIRCSGGADITYKEDAANTLPLNKIRLVE